MELKEYREQKENRETERLRVRAKRLLGRADKRQKPPSTKDPRLTDMVEMRLNDNSLEMIGKKYGISRERVRQILATTGVKFPRYKPISKTIRVDKVCPRCSKNFSVVPSLAKIKKFCSRECFRVSPEHKAERQKHNSKKWGIKYKGDPRYVYASKLRNAGVLGVSIHDKDLFDTKIPDKKIIPDVMSTAKMLGIDLKEQRMVLKKMKRQGRSKGSKTLFRKAKDWFTK